jgi:hypothetical protein
MIDLLNWDGIEPQMNYKPVRAEWIEGVSNRVLNNSMVAEAVAIATRYVGEEEVPRGSNWGPFVRRCLASVGIGFAAPWCNAFVYLVYQEAAEKARWVNPVVRTGHVVTGWNKTKGTKVPGSEIVKLPTVLQPGDQFIMRFKNGLGHTGIITEVKGRRIHTIEGNTNNAGGREGFGVLRKVRRPEELFGAISYRLN